MNLVQWICLCLLSLAVVLYAEWAENRKLVLAFKPLASTGFLGLAVWSGAFDSLYGQLVFAALVGSFLGDVVLLDRSEKGVKLGIFFFGLAHVMYVVAFGVAGLKPSMAVIPATTGVIASALVYRWLASHVSSEMKGLVIGYLVIVTAMMITSITLGASGHIWVGIAGTLFYLSDITVARQRFVEKSMLNRLLGLPAYYVAQLIFASALV